MHRLIEDYFGRLSPAPDGGRHDSAVLEELGRLAFTTDSYVIDPIFFPGGDIGSLAVTGTVNDLAVAGARPMFLSLSVILEEGFPLDSLRRVCDSILEASRCAGVSIVTGDTKVVERGRGDGIYINTAGLGLMAAPEPPGPRRIRSGQVAILSGDLGRHGLSVLCSRGDLGVKVSIPSDIAAIHGSTLALLEAGVGVSCMRDLTRGGLAAAVTEIAEASGTGMELVESSIPLHPEVSGACELLGLDPLQLANEGRFLAFVDASDAGRALDIMERTGPGGAAVIGVVREDPLHLVRMVSSSGGARVVGRPSGDQFPRIC